ncbi:MAG TPA: hypothetical protein VEF53_18750 [Patescibacteria group bacterium]|nr:hypothetical protein [Patescibacteria group bacterium]
MEVFEYAVQVRIYFEMGKQVVLDHIKKQGSKGNMAIYEDYNGKQYLVMLDKVTMIEMAGES